MGAKDNALNVLALVRCKGGAIDQLTADASAVKRGMVGMALDQLGTAIEQSTDDQVLGIAEQIVHLVGLVTIDGNVTAVLPKEPDE